MGGSTPFSPTVRWQYSSLGLVWIGAKHWGNIVSNSGKQTLAGLRPSYRNATDTAPGRAAACRDGVRRHVEEVYQIARRKHQDVFGDFAQIKEPLTVVSVRVAGEGMGRQFEWNGLRGRMLPFHLPGKDVTHSNSSSSFGMVQDELRIGFDMSDFPS